MKFILQNANTEQIKKDIEDSEKYLARLPYDYKVLGEARDYVKKQRDIYTSIKNKVLNNLKQGYLKIDSDFKEKIEDPIKNYRAFESSCNDKIASLKSYASEVKQRMNKNKQLLKDLEKK